MFFLNGVTNWMENLAEAVACWRGPVGAGRAPTRWDAKFDSATQFCSSTIFYLLGLECPPLSARHWVEATHLLKRRVKNGASWGENFLGSHVGTVPYPDSNVFLYFWNTDRLECVKQKQNSGPLSLSADSEKRSAEVIYVERKVAT